MSLVDRRGREVFIFYKGESIRRLSYAPIDPETYLPTIEPTPGVDFLRQEFSRTSKYLISYIKPKRKPGPLATTEGHRICMAGGLSAALIKETVDLGHGCYRANSMDEELI